MDVEHHETITVHDVDEIYVYRDGEMFRKYDVAELRGHDVHVEMHGSETDE